MRHTSQAKKTHSEGCGTPTLQATTSRTTQLLWRSRIRHHGDQQEARDNLRVENTIHRVNILLKAAIVEITMCFLTPKHAICITHPFTTLCAMTRIRYKRHKPSNKNNASSTNRQELPRKRTSFRLCLHRKAKERKCKHRSCEQRQGRTPTGKSTVCKTSSANCKTMPDLPTGFIVSTKKNWCHYNTHQHHKINPQEKHCDDRFASIKLVIFPCLLVIGGNCLS